jgi:hypothetical protein
MTEAEIENLVGSWTVHMRRGEFERAWQISDRMLRARQGERCDHLPPDRRWVWDGSPLGGRRVVVRSFRGLGDTIQCIRYLPLLKHVAAQTIVCAPPELMPVVSTVAGTDRVIKEDYHPLPYARHDVQIEMMELPWVFRTTLASIPAEIPYINVDRYSIERPHGLAVGLVWQAGDWDTRRSIPFAQMNCLQDVPGIRWTIIQRGPGLSQWDGRMGTLSPADTVFEQARVMRSLDLVISVDSMPVHLSGALGVPTWILLHTEADWRWLEGRDDTPWYPHAHLFRQEQSGDWKPVLARVRDALANRGVASPSTVA